MPSIRVLVVEDNKPFQRFICSALGKRPELQVVGVVSDGLAAVQSLQGCAVMRYNELKTWEDFAKALSQNPDPRSLTYLIDGLKRALEEDERKILPKPPRSKAA